MSTNTSPNRHRVTEQDIARMYQRHPSFTDFLPWTDYDPKSRCFLLEDGISVGAVFEAVMIPCEAKPAEFMTQIREALQNALADGLPDNSASPWILQAYLQDEPGLGRFADQFSNYCQTTSNPRFRETFVDLYREHLANISKPGGIFFDSAVLGGPWRGKVRVARLVIYRRLDIKTLDGVSVLPETELNDVCSKFVTSVAQAGVKIRRCEGRDVYEWLVRWFNPSPAATQGDVDRLLALAPYPGDDQLPYGYDFAQAMLFSQPESDANIHGWRFDGLPHRIITVSALRRRATSGHFTAERQVGENHVFSLFDRLPERSILAMTVVLKPHDEVLNHLANIRRGCIGDGADAILAKQQVDAAEHASANGDRLYPATVAIYVSATDDNKLRTVVNEVTSLLLSNNLQTISLENDQLAIDAYIRSLPMAYDYRLDRVANRARLFYASDIAALLPLCGRSRGTGNPGLPFFNRGGEPLYFDPLSRQDRSKNAHMLILGPTGAGKSALCIYLAMLVAVVHNARLVIAEAGNSFGLFGKFMRHQGFSVNQVSLSPSADVSLPPFADATKLLSKPTLVTLPDEVDEDDRDDENEDERDLLGEMEIAARLMITGGEENESRLMTRADRNTIRRAIYRAAENVFARDPTAQVLTEDVVCAMREIAEDSALTQERRSRAIDMADALALFTGGFEGRLFNRPGVAWPEADVTIVDFATLARDGYQDKLAVAYVGLMNRIHDLVERNQHGARPTVMLTDEGHIITTNPLLASYNVKIVKMWRKLGAWYWVATQNLEDFPDAAKKMLNMMEWWLLLVMPKEEVEQLARFKDLNPETRALLLSARKEPGKYVEGVVLSDKLKALFRNVPPPLCLALAQTEKEEKTYRHSLMRENGWDDELLAVYAIAKELERKRAA
jgi:conjugative transfer ATPase